MKDKLGGNIMTEFAVLRPQTYSYLTNDSHENKKQKTQKGEKIKFEDYRHCLKPTHQENKINHLEKK